MFGVTPHGTLRCRLPNLEQSFQHGFTGGGGHFEGSIQLTESRVPLPRIPLAIADSIKRDCCHNMYFASCHPDCSPALFRSPLFVHQQLQVLPSSVEERRRSRASSFGSLGGFEVGLGPQS